MRARLRFTKPAVPETDIYTVSVSRAGRWSARFCLPPAIGYNPRHERTIPAQKQTDPDMAFPAAEKLTILIDINNNIAAGLREVSSDAQLKPVPTDSEAHALRPEPTFQAVAG